MILEGRPISDERQMSSSIQQQIFQILCSYSGCTFNQCFITKFCSQTVHLKVVLLILKIIINIWARKQNCIRVDYDGYLRLDTEREKTRVHELGPTQILAPTRL